jgi:hypothetical protein
MSAFKSWIESRVESATPRRENVWPMPPGQRIQPLRTLNGFGSVLYSWSLPDAGGRQLATRWLCAAGLPLLPTARYYVTKGGTQHGYRRESTSYQIHGRAHLRADEILRTYVYFWLLVPGVLLIPLILLAAFTNAALAITWFFIAFVMLLVWATMAPSVSRAFAPLYAVRWNPDYRGFDN